MINLKNKKIYLIVIPCLFILPIYFATSFLTTKTMPYVTEEIIDMYKEAAEKESKPGATINWKCLIAIDTVRFKQDFSNMSLRKARKTAKKFIRVIREEDDEGNVTIRYELKSINEVMDELNFSDEEKESAHLYLSVGLGGFDEGGSGGSSSKGAEGVIYKIPRFYQYDGRWATHPYGESTIGQGGCGTTSFAMVATGMNPKGLRYLDKNKDGILDPVEASDWSAANGYKVPGNGTAWGFFAHAGRVIGLEVSQYEKSNYERVYEELKKGYPVIASMAPGHFTRSGHFIVLTGVDENGKVIVNDPASEERSNMKWDYLSIVVPEAVQFWTFKKPLGSSETYELTSYTGDPSENGGDLGRYAADGKTDLWKLDIKDRVIAVWPGNIKLGEKVYIEFPNDVRYIKLKDGSKFDLNGVYTAVDTGGAITDHRIDLYVGFDGTGNKGFYYNLADYIGRRKVRVYKDF